ncbi:NADPH azoreductase [Pigmentiphaga humi]|uniref:NADPH azoreductase n=1 Tax=Pigmentiphaga humi TaxID=2478468 RepID=A0A3P4B7G2_9BURK|nr:NAD(P)H-dependent oxidoreductase [Pigmentiphaga humi]VCU71881.1 NADPH azoreductase [Pigmentiphaga humi]
MNGKPLVVGIGGTLRADSSSECALRLALAAARQCGTEVLQLSGADLDLPLYSPNEAARSASARKLIAALREASGVIIASPSYHGGISGLVKNALDYVEDLRTGERPYLDGMPVGLISCGGGWQGAASALSNLRAIVHALRGWPTPLGGVINTSQKIFDQQGRCLDEGAAAQLATVGRQVAQQVLLAHERHMTAMSA